MAAADLGTRPLLDLLLDAGFIPSKGEGRRLIQQNGLYLNGQPVQDPACCLTSDDFTSGEAVVRKGKKAFHRILIG
jgi:tyrosyl-tRNA synthetase